MSDHDIVVLSAVRTPMGRFGGSLKEVQVYELGAAVLRQALERSGVAPSEVGEVFLGCCRQAGHGTNPARTAARLAGLPGEVPATTVTMACAAGMRAIILGVQVLRAGDAKFVLTGGMESMSTMPYLLLGARWPKPGPNGKRLIDGWWDSRDPFTGLGTGEVTEQLIRKHGISREDQDRFALESHRRAAQAQDEGWFQEEVAPLTLPSPQRDQTISFHKDESIRRDTSMEKLAGLKPAFREDGTLTAGNSSSLTDGAAAFLLTTREVARAGGLKPLFSIISYSVGAADNAFMGEGPSVVLPKALDRAGLKIGDLDLLEVNEAFSGMVLANERILKWDPARLNVHGGAIALGHPVGASGARIVVTLAHALRRKSGELGAAAVGAAGGVAAALVIRRES